MSIAFVFSGQGAQTVGMGQSFYDQYDSAKQIFKQASQVVGYDVAELCFTDSEGKLNNTAYTQVALLTTCTAIASALTEQGVVAQAVAGLSLGEYSALVYAGALQFDEAATTLAARGRLMNDAVVGLDSKMVAVLNTARDIIVSVCEQVRETGKYVAPSNYNMPGQIVISGEREAVEQAEELLKSEHGVKRCLPLRVSGPFHTKLLAPAAVGLRPYLEAVNWQEPRIPVISNTTVEPFRQDNVVEVLTEQVSSPVYWEDCVKKLVSLGVDTIVEIGPNKVLSKFIKKIDETLTVYTVEHVDDIPSLVTALKS